MSAEKYCYYLKNGDVISYDDEVCTKSGKWVKLINEASGYGFHSVGRKYSQVMFPKMRRMIMIGEKDYRSLADRDSFQAGDELAVVDDEFCFSDNPDHWIEVTKAEKLFGVKLVGTKCGSIYKSVRREIK